MRLCGISMSEAVTVPSLIMMNSIVSEDSLAHRHTHTRVVYVNICNYDFANKTDVP